MTPGFDPPASAGSGTRAAHTIEINNDSPRSNIQVIKIFIGNKAAIRGMQAHLFFRSSFNYQLFYSYFCFQDTDKKKKKELLPSQFLSIILRKYRTFTSVIKIMLMSQNCRNQG